jgi:hydrogenase nickel incorporation protein HypA/HybF
MHEMSIALGIVDIARKALAEAEADRIESITLEIGTLAGVQLDSLHFVWPAAVADTPLEGAERIIEQPQGMALCLECHTTFPVSKHYDACTNCGGYFKEILSGKELNVKSMVFTKASSKIH